MSLFWGKKEASTNRPQEEFTALGNPAVSDAVLDNMSAHTIDRFGFNLYGGKGDTWFEYAMPNTAQKIHDLSRDMETMKAMMLQLLKENQALRAQIDQISNRI